MIMIVNMKALVQAVREDFKKVPDDFLETQNRMIVDYKNIEKFLNDFTTSVLGNYPDIIITEDIEEILKNKIFDHIQEHSYFERR